MPKVGDIYNLITINTLKAYETDDVATMMDKLRTSNPSSRSVYVIDNDNTLKGVITVQDILKLIAVNRNVPVMNRISMLDLFSYSSPNRQLSDIMKPPYSVSVDEKLEVALLMMIRFQVEELAVVDESNRLLGDLNVYELIRNID